ncbi:tyramine/octopamine receptor [Folsomia candida]|nr:tyramine/octopamine receptor [Folsomia candida]
MPELSRCAQIPLIIFLSLVSIAAILGNGLVLLAWAFHAPVRKPQNSYLLSLAVVDLLVGLILAPSMIGEIGSQTWPWGREWCQLYLLVDWLLTTSSVLHLVAVSMDRYHVVFDTLTYGVRRTFPFFMRRICLLWILTVWLIAPEMRDWEAMGDRSVDRGMCLSSVSRELSVHFAFGSFVLPVALLVGLGCLGRWENLNGIHNIFM